MKSNYVEPVELSIKLILPTFHKDVDQVGYLEDNTHYYRKVLDGQADVYPVG